MRVTAKDTMLLTMETFARIHVLSEWGGLRKSDMGGRPGRGCLQVKENPLEAVERGSCWGADVAPSQIECDACEDQSYCVSSGREVAHAMEPVAALEGTEYRLDG